MVRACPFTCLLAFYIVGCAESPQSTQPKRPTHDAATAADAHSNDSATSAVDNAAGPNQTPDAHTLLDAHPGESADAGVGDAAQPNLPPYDAAAALDARADDTDDAAVDSSDIATCVEDTDAGPLTCPPTQRCSGDSESTIRVVSWNIKVGEVRGLAAVVDVLRDVSADVLLLQEVDQSVHRSGDVDQVRAIAEELGYRSAFAPTVALEGGLYGIAVLARIPFQSVRRLPLSNRQVGEPRTAIEAEFCWGRSTIRIVNHHADYLQAGAEESVTELALALTTTLADVPTLFAGDFNQAPSARGSEACIQAGLRDVLAEFDPTPTFGDRRIDYVFADQRAATVVESAHVLPTDASDHALVAVDLRVQ